jgi:hypothetical protein
VLGVQAGALLQQGVPEGALEGASEEVPAAAAACPSGVVWLAVAFLLYTLSSSWVQHDCCLPDLVSTPPVVSPSMLKVFFCE